MRRLSQIAVRVALLAAILALAGTGARAEQVPVVIGYQPGTFGGLPFIVASRLGLWQAEGLSAVLVSFPAPTPFIMAAGVRGWDVGAAGPGAAVIGAGRFGLRAVALTSEEGGATFLLAPRAFARQVREASMRVDGWRLLVAAGSASALVARSCLRWLGLDDASVIAVDVMATDVGGRFAGAQPAFAALAAPQAWQLLASGEAMPVCSGGDAGIALPGFLVARPTFAREQPDTVRRVVAVYIRALAWIAARPDALIPLARDYYAGAGIVLPDQALRDDLDARRIYGAEEQRSLFDRSAGPSTIDRWVDRLAVWLAFAGAPDVPAGRDFLTGSFLPAGQVAAPQLPRGNGDGAGRPSRPRVR